jgi:hypothetical protein
LTPAVRPGHLRDQVPVLGIYIVGPVPGAMFGAALWEFVLSKGRKQAIENVGQEPYADEPRAVPHHTAEERQ